MAGQIKARTLKVPITNVYAKGDYCAQLNLGKPPQRVNLILDTGSSTLVVKQSAVKQNVENQSDVNQSLENHSAYRPEDDKLLTPTSLAQEVNYGIGGWDGPVITTRVAICEDKKTLDKQPHLHLPHQPLVLESCHLAIVSGAKQQQSFGDADGIFGLGYHHLNKSYDLKAYLDRHNYSPAVTYPWPFANTNAKNRSQSEANVKCAAKSNNQDSSTNNPKAEAPLSSEDLTQFKQFLWQQPERDLIPYFTDLEEHGLTANKFAFYCRRSSVHVSNDASTPQQLADDPLNQGWLILGDAEQHTEFYQGELNSIKVEHDIYYNVTLTSIRVGDQTPIAAAPLEEKYRKNYYSNAIVDTGASAIALTEPLYRAMLNDLAAISPKFAPLIAPFKDISAQQTGIDASALELSQWPDISFTFVGDMDVKKGTSTESPDRQEVSIVCKPESYWQLNAPSEGRACFKILSQLPNWPNQTLLGLPLLNDHLVIFDRSVHKTGVIRFAEASSEQDKKHKEKRQGR
ncbi:pepsin-like aspartic protease [Shewanella atlantica]|uniref:A1 family peptidase n=1 Tax=Shewanella atlantica TaxID=271099 RepID=A0A431W2R0_9GAMM|nr:pepsin-like aspartic protease [Shewanella atlantica]RTR29714.1 A1 family peptidase [Shewanella atlantica]